MAETPALVRRVEWHELFPWLLLFRVIGVAVSGRALLLATMGLLLSSGGWWLANALCSPKSTLLPSRSGGTSPDPQATPSGQPQQALSPTASGSDPQGLANPILPRTSQPSYEPPRTIADAVGAAFFPWQRWYRQLWDGWRYLLSPPETLREAAYLLLGGIWSILVWLVFGGAILRIATARLGREVWLGPRSAVRHVMRKTLSYLGAPLLPLAALVIGLLLLAALGLCMRVNFLFAFAALLWPLAILGAFVWVLLFLGLVFGWPLMWAALGTEQDADAWDAVSRGYACVLQKPLRYIFYVAMVAIPGWLGWVLVYHVGHLTVYVAQHWVLWGAGAAADPWRDAVFGTGEASGLLFGWIIPGLNRLVTAIASSYGYSYFFCAAAAVYLLLRLDTTQTSLDEVYLGEEDDSLRLPPLPSTPETTTEVSSNPAGA